MRLLQDTPAIAEHKPVGATAPAEGAEARSFAAVAVGGRQHKVTEGDVLIVDRLPGLEVGQQAEWDQVLLVGSAAKTIVGRPLVPGAIVKVSVEQQTYAAKLPIFKKRRRKGYKRFNTFRRPITVLRVDEIECDLLQ
jgi:large subunit ribosomal protein L21